MARVRWGILSTSRFALTKILPAIRHCQHTLVHAIASRELLRAQDAARTHGIPRAYGSYEELLADPEIEIVYVPAPNHMHVPWSIRAVQAGKHVLCEKPLGLSTGQVRDLIAARDAVGVKVAEAFMIRTHPQWIRARELIRAGAIGPLRAIQSAFSYFLDNPANVRNQAGMGGGGLLDIGCYAVYLSRMLFGEEPQRVVGALENDARFGVDRLCSAILAFPSGQSVFICGTQHVPYQRVHAFGVKGRLELEIPFNAPSMEPVRLSIDDGSDVRGSAIRTETIAPCDQYAIQADLFSLAVRNRTEVAVPLEDSLRNAAVLEAIFRSAQSGRWESPSV